MTDPGLDRRTRVALADFLLCMADDEFVIGFSDSEWTGIAPILEEDVAISSIAQDELGHARAFYELLATLLDDGRDADAIAYDREPAEYRHSQLLDHGRGNWAVTMARRFLYDTADEARLASIGEGWPPLAELVVKIRREERYHVMHVALWADRLARAGGEARAGFIAALGELGPDAATVLTPPVDEAALLEAGILNRPMVEATAAWRTAMTEILGPLGIQLSANVPARARSDRAGVSDDFRWLWGEFTSVRRSEIGATW